MDKFVRSKLFWVIVAAYSAVFFAAFYYINLSYRAEVEILFIPKSQNLSQNLSQVVGNAKEIAKTQGYSKSFDSDISKNNLQAEIIGSSSIIKLTIFDKNESRAQALATQAARNLASIMSQYYNIKDDLDIRFIDGPKTAKSFPINYTLAILASILAGFVLSVFVHYITGYASSERINRIRSFFPDGFSSKKWTIPQEEPYDFAKPFAHEKQPERYEKPKEEIIKFTSPEPETFPTPEKKAAAPDNLPVADTPSLFDLNGEEKSKITPEEIKSRLNKLLNGKM